MTPNDVARRLGMILSPAQELYRFHRRHGVDRHRAREMARYGAASLAATQTTAVMRFIQEHAVWTIPDGAWPTKTVW